MGWSGCRAFPGVGGHDGRDRFRLRRAPGGPGSAVQGAALSADGPVVDEVAAAVAALPHARVALLGHCSGAVIAYEVARTLRSLRAPALARLIVVAQQAPRGLAASSLDVDPVASIPERFRGDPEFAEMLIPTLAADMKMISDYEYLPAEPLDVPITVICGSRDDAVSHEELGGWRKETSRATDWREVADADHLFSGDAWLKLGDQVRAVLA